MAVRDDLVGGVDDRHRVLEIHDRRDGGLEDEVLHAGEVGRADRAAGVDTDLDAEAVVLQEHHVGRGGVAPVADEAVRVDEADHAPVVESDDERAALDLV